MPVILQRDTYNSWLNQRSSADELKSLLKPVAEIEMKMHPVGQAVNSIDNDYEELTSQIVSEIGFTQTLF